MRSPGNAKCASTSTPSGITATRIPARLLSMYCVPQVMKKNGRQLPSSASQSIQPHSTRVRGSRLPAAMAMASSTSEPSTSRAAITVSVSKPSSATLIDR